MNFLKKSKLLKFARKYFGKIALKYYFSNKGIIIYYNDNERSSVIDFIHSIKHENDLFLGYEEAYQIHMGVKNTAKIPGEIAEVGVFRGGSAKIICNAKGTKKLHLFDTFDGLPEITKYDDTYFYKGQFVSNLDYVKNYLKEYSDIYFYQGYFPSTAKDFKETKFSFVNLDVDIYESTKNAIEYFYPKMSIGGIIISHDYINSKGVRKAINDFFADKPEPVIELAGSQCLIVKTLAGDL